MENKKNFAQKLKSLTFFIWGKIRGIFSWYKRLWIKFTYNKYGELVYKRVLAMVAGTFAALVIIPAVIGFVFQVGYYLTTVKTETVYLIQSEQIYPDENIWGVRGCYTHNCESSSSVYFRIKPGIFHHMWSLSDNGHFFLPDALGASVPTGLTECEVVSYGIRTRIMMMFNVYPNILKITCEKGIANPPL